MPSTVKIAPSILSADFAKLGDEVLKRKTFKLNDLAIPEELIARIDSLYLLEEAGDEIQRYMGFTTTLKTYLERGNDKQPLDGSALKIIEAMATRIDRAVELVVKIQDG